MMTCTRAAKVERWSRHCTFELDTAAGQDGATASGKRRSRRPFASASVALSEGVINNPSAGYSPPPPKPKVCTHSGFI